ncbi:10125_t:CDS:2 [Gigaspora margarita]|uniref:10125_t:CDS:1 n=1 Tax=Gigaspora margarita TaxID=4874 RepID=A0ABN7VWU6_GIGMA|nr:10125_t:CDS:2 [Gigaspora margarita]
MFIEDGKLEKFDNEIDNNDLKHILVNGNRLYISTLQKNKVTIYTGPREGPRRSFRCILDKGAFLSYIWKELENDFMEQMSVQNDGEIEQAKYRAFILRINQKVTLEKLENHKEATKYSYSMVGKAKIDFSKNNLSATPEFIKDVEEALEGETHARSVYFGGIIVQKLQGVNYSNEHTKSEESNTAAKIESEYVKTKFGAVLKTLNRNKATIHKTTHSYTIK